MDLSMGTPGGGGGGDKRPPTNLKGGPPSGPGKAAAPGGRKPAAQNRSSEDSGNNNINNGQTPPLPLLPNATVDASGRVILGPGAYPVAGPGFGAAAEREASAAGGGTSDVANASGRSAATDGALVDGEAVFEGYVPEPTPEEAEEARIRAEVEEMKRTAVSLDTSAVRVIDESDREEGTGASSGPGEKEEGIIARRLKSPLGVVCLTVTILLAIALAVAFGSGGGEETGSAGEPSMPTCTIASVQETYDVARSIVSNITSDEELDDPASPQARALEWLACEDQISSALIEARDPATGALPALPHGTAATGTAGEAQLLRRYILATFYYATSADGPWRESLNFLSGDRHECRWHENKTRSITLSNSSSFGLGGSALVGHVCRTTINREQIVLMDDAERQIGRLHLSIKIPNNLTGTLPSELGHLADLFTIALENHKGLRGSIPSTLGNLQKLRAWSILYNGPDFGGVVPPSMFKCSVMFFMMLFNEGSWELPPMIDAEILNKSRIVNFIFRSSGLSGTVPPYLFKLNNLEILDLSDNPMEGSLPDSIGDSTSLEFLNLHASNLNGTLPASLGKLANIDAMILEGNNFMGPLPPSLGNLSKLKLLDLGHNELEGTVPSTFSSLVSLEHISLHHNLDLHGPISAFESLQNLSSLALYGNAFSSTLPGGLFSGAAGRKIIADLGHNDFVGDLPEALTKYASNTTLLSIMRNDLDSDAVEDVICDEVSVLFADCNSCTCCQSCCREESTDPNDPYCHYDFNFYDVVGTEYQCFSRGLPGRVCPDGGSLSTAARPP